MCTFHRTDVGRPILAAAAFSGGQGRLKADCGQNARPTRSKLVITTIEAGLFRDAEDLILSRGERSTRHAHTTGLTTVCAELLYRKLSDIELPACRGLPSPTWILPVALPLRSGELRADPRVRPPACPSKEGPTERRAHLHRSAAAPSAIAADEVRAPECARCGALNTAGRSSRSRTAASPKTVDWVCRTRRRYSSTEMHAHVPRQDVPPLRTRAPQLPHPGGGRRVETGTCWLKGSMKLQRGTLRPPAALPRAASAWSKPMHLPGSQRTRSCRSGSKSAHHQPAKTDLFPWLRSVRFNWRRWPQCSIGCSKCSRSH
jgi:hypothetical protein